MTQLNVHNIRILKSQKNIVNNIYLTLFICGSILYKFIPTNNLKKKLTQSGTDYKYFVTNIGTEFEISVAMLGQN